MVIRTLVCVVLINWATAAAWAGPWTPRRGHGQVIVNVSFYETHEEFDRDGERDRFDFDGRFSKLEVNPFLELGVTDRLALLVNLFASRQAFDNEFGGLSNAGLGDSELGLRYRLSSPDRPLQIALQGFVKFATAERGGEVSLGNRQFDADLRLVLGGSIGKSARPPFWTVEGGYRWRDDGPADEVRLEGTFGVHISSRVMLMGQLMSTIGMRNADAFDHEGNPTLSPDYDLHRLQGSAIFRVSPRMRLQAAGFVHAFGRNTGAGGGALLAAWVEF